MVKPEGSNRVHQLNGANTVGDNGNNARYKGVRMRKWGKWVAEVRLPNSRDRVWLGSYDTAEKAARAYDAAVYCVRGPNAVFNFPRAAPPEIRPSRNLSHQQIQAVASTHARQEPREPAAVVEDGHGRRAGAMAETTSTMSLDQNPNPVVVGMPRESNGDEILNWPSLEFTFTLGVGDEFNSCFYGFLGDF